MVGAGSDWRNSSTDTVGGDGAAVGLDGCAVPLLEVAVLFVSDGVGLDGSAVALLGTAVVLVPGGVALRVEVHTTTPTTMAPSATETRTKNRVRRFHLAGMPPSLGATPSGMISPSTGVASTRTDETTGSASTSEGRGGGGAGSVCGTGPSSSTASADASDEREAVARVAERSGATR
jgi:hypothetical protein